MELISDETWRDLWPRLLVYVRHMGTALRRDAEDIAAEIMLKAVKAADRYDSRRPFRTWFFSIAHNHCIDELRRRGRAPAPQNRSADDTAYQSIRASARYSEKAQTAAGPEEQLLRSEEAAAVRDYLSDLPPADREISFLRFYEELKYRQIAEIVGLPEGSVKYRVHIIKKGLKEFWRSRYEEEIQPKKSPTLDPGLLP
jgi:RNA polymerase sigma-70 factor (ECF subfamily)